ncbi:translation initiation factor IF-2-like [Aquila chrysaetos chrysaetos]|uniref:translation initiation factor IF-2-like n=1 Tax=Aquila chrysaetos chrysaetos TaxID=223781 RepID=UPI001176A761|nr:translation initiation factor IF-2-like [Aquila chrysaetos chrysaetos]
MGGWGGERVVGKTQRPASPGSPSRETCLHPRPARPPPSPPAPPASPPRDAPPAAAGSLPAPGAPRPALTAEPGAPSHPGVGSGRRKKFGAGRGGRGAGRCRGRCRSRRGGESGVAAQPGDCISPLPAAAAAAVIFQAHRGSPLRARLPSSLPPRPGSSRRRLSPARPRRGRPGPGAAPAAARGAPAGPAGAATARCPHPGAGPSRGGGEGPTAAPPCPGGASSQIAASIYNALMSEERWIFLPLAIVQVAVSKRCSCASKTTQGTEDTESNSTLSRTEASAIRDIVLTQTRA